MKALRSFNKTGNELKYGSTVRSSLEVTL